MEVPSKTRTGIEPLVIYPDRKDSEVELPSCGSMCGECCALSARGVAALGKYLVKGAAKGVGKLASAAGAVSSAANEKAQASRSKGGWLMWKAVSILTDPRTIAAALLTVGVLATGGILGMALIGVGLGLGVLGAIHAAMGTYQTMQAHGHGKLAAGAAAATVFALSMVGIGLSMAGAKGVDALFGHAAGQAVGNWVSRHLGDGVSHFLTSGALDSQGAAALAERSAAALGTFLLPDAAIQGGHWLFQRPGGSPPPSPADREDDGQAGDDLPSPLHRRTVTRQTNLTQRTDLNTVVSESTLDITGVKNPDRKRPAPTQLEQDDGEQKNGGENDLKADSQNSRPSSISSGDDLYDDVAHVHQPPSQGGSKVGDPFVTQTNAAWGEPQGAKHRDSVEDDHDNQPQLQYGHDDTQNMPKHLHTAHQKSGEMSMDFGSQKFSSRISQVSSGSLGINSEGGDPFVTGGTNQPKPQHIRPQIPSKHQKQGTLISDVSDLFDPMSSSLQSFGSSVEDSKLSSGQKRPELSKGGTHAGSEGTEFAESVIYHHHADSLVPPLNETDEEDDDDDDDLPQVQQQQQQQQPIQKSAPKMGNIEVDVAIESEDESDDEDMPEPNQAPQQNPKKNDLPKLRNQDSGGSVVSVTENKGDSQLSQANVKLAPDPKGLHRPKPSDLMTEQFMKSSLGIHARKASAFSNSLSDEAYSQFEQHVAHDNHSMLAMAINLDAEHGDEYYTEVNFGRAYEDVVKTLTQLETDFPELKGFYTGQARAIQTQIAETQNWKDGFKALAHLVSREDGHVNDSDLLMYRTVYKNLRALNPNRVAEIHQQHETDLLAIHRDPAKLEDSGLVGDLLQALKEERARSRHNSLQSQSQQELP